MKSFAVLLLLLLAQCSFAQSTDSSAPDMASAPNFEQLLKNDFVRVFLLTLNRGQQVVANHSHNFLMITLQDCEVVMWPEGKSDVTSFRLNQGDTDFFFGGAAGGIRNEQTQTFRAVFVEFMDPNVTTFGYQSDQGTWGYGFSAVRAPVDPHAKFSNGMDLHGATVSDVQLLSGDSLDATEKPKPELLIPVSDVDLSAGHNLKISNSSGEVAWIPLGRKSALENNSADPARFILVDFSE
jgi:hypothetical protein